MVGAACRRPAADDCRWTCRRRRHRFFFWQELPPPVPRILRPGHYEPCQGPISRTAWRGGRSCGGNGSIWNSHTVAASDIGDQNPSLQTIQEEDAEECAGMFDSVATTTITWYQEAAKCGKACNLGGQYPPWLSLRRRAVRAGDGAGRLSPIPITNVIKYMWHCPQIYNSKSRYPSSAPNHTVRRFQLPTLLSKHGVDSSSGLCRYVGGWWFGAQRERLHLPL